MSQLKTAYPIYHPVCHARQVACRLLQLCSYYTKEFVRFKKKRQMHHKVRDSTQLPRTVKSTNRICFIPTDDNNYKLVVCQNQFLWVMHVQTLKPVFSGFFKYLHIRYSLQYQQHSHCTNIITAVFGGHDF